MKRARGLGLAATTASGVLVAREAWSYRIREAHRATNAAIRTEAAATLSGAESPGPGHVAVVMAAFNEADGISAVLAGIPYEVSGRRTRVIVVDDGSADGTATVARSAGATVAIHARNLGQGDALRTGFSVAVAGGADVVVTMDADGQHQPDQIEDLVQPLLDDEADYVQGSRFLGEYADAGGARDVGIRSFTTLINLVGGVHITDCTNGFRAIRADGLHRMRLSEDRFSAPEIILEARARGLRMLEVPVRIDARSHGESKKPRGLGYPLGFARAIIEVKARQVLRG